jgi:hypothetical protein
MVQCKCHTGKDGQGPQCSRNAKEGEHLCAQHMRTCMTKSAQTAQRVQHHETPKPARKISKVQRHETPKAKSRRGCVQQSTKKYVERPSPSYPANECCGQVMRGNDGIMYISKANVKGICQWKPFKQ